MLVTPKSKRAIERAIHMDKDLKAVVITIGVIMFIVFIIFY